MANDTDSDWEAWGKSDPYFGVITDPRFHRAQLDDAAHRLFFETGRAHVVHVLETCRARFKPDFSPFRTLDFGCGVGRVTIPMARHTHEAVGMDVSPSMLDEARRNGERHGVLNVEWVQGGDPGVFPPGHFDLVHSAIVLQHIDIERGTRIFGGLVKLVSPGGIGAIQVTYAKAYHADMLGMPPTNGRARAAQPRTGNGAEPPMLMNAYLLNPLLFQIQDTGVRDLYVEFTDHGGELGVFLFFRKPQLV
jgi:SAM-dependent methyltransferase